MKKKSETALIQEQQTQCTCITAHDRAVCIGWCENDKRLALEDRARYDSLGKRKGKR